MSVRWSVMASFVLLLSGCGPGLSYVEANYGGENGPDVHTPLGDYKILDHPNAGKMLTLPTVGQLLAHIPPPPGTTIIVEVDPELIAQQGAAKQWFLQNGRNCTIIKSVEVVPPEFEHTYTCK